MPATIVGNANGRSMRASTAPRPGKRSRTRTHAMSVPATALIAATATDRISVSRSAATAWRLETAAQNASRPPSVERATTAASGMRTMTLSHTVATPSDSAPDPPGAAEESARRRAVRSGPPGRPGVRASLRSGDSRGFLDLRHRSGLGVEEVVVDLRPAAEVADREQALGGGEPRRVALQHRLVHRPVAPLGELLLRRRRERVTDERLGLGRVLRALDDRDGVLDQDRLVGDDVVDLLALALGGDRLVLVGQQDVAGAGGEVLQRLAAGLVLHRDVLRDELAQVGQAGVGALTAAALRAVAGEQVPLRRARGERVGSEHLDPRLEQVVPGADVLGVALADDERDDRARDEPLGRVCGPALVDEPGLDESSHVGLERERHHVGGEAGLDRAALVAGRAEGL